MSSTQTEGSTSSQVGSLLTLDERFHILVFDSIFFNEIYRFELHESQIHNILIVNDQYVISNCTRGRVYFWDIVDENDKSGPASYAFDDVESLEKRSFGHSHTKPYSSYVYDDENDLFIACLPEKYPL